MDAQPSQELRQLIQKVSQGSTLSEDEIRTALDQILEGGRCVCLGHGAGADEKMCPTLPAITPPCEPGHARWVPCG